MLRDYFNSRADIWDEQVAEKDKDKLKRLAQKLELAPGSVILDVGSGTGIFLPWLLKCIGRQGKVVALDIAEEMLARSMDKHLGENIEYLNADIADIPLDDDMFDSVICYSSFPHFQDKPKALAEMKRVLKKGGRVFVCHSSSREHINTIHRDIPEVRDDLLPDLEDMNLLLSDAGYHSIYIEEDSESYFARAIKPEL